MARKIIQFFKRYWVFIFLAAIAGGLIMLRLSQRSQPSPPTIQPTRTPQPPLIKPLAKPKIAGFKIPLNAKLASTDFSFPSQLKIYQGQENKIFSDKAIKIAQEFNFSQSPQKSEDVLLGKFYTWASETQALSVALEAGQIGYSLDLSQAQLSTQGALPSPEATKAVLENLLAKLDLTPGFEFKWQKEKYEKADFIKIGFNPGLDQYQLIGLNPQEPLVSLTLGRDGQIVYFQYQLSFFAFEELGIYNLKTKEEVQNTLVSEGRIVYIQGQKSAQEPKITQAWFNQIRLAYFQDSEKTSVIQPIFILRGQGTLENNQQTEIIAYLPAVSFTPAP